ncbi:DUF4352 domain-containing protein [Streptomyces sp. NPDC055078]
MSHSMHQQQPQYGHHAPAPHPMRNGLGTAALILGIIGAVAGIIPFLFWLGGTLGLIALILGLVGRGRVKRGEANNKGVTTVGALLGLVAMILGVVGAVITFKAVDDAVDEISKSVEETTATKEAAPGSDSDADSGSDSGKSKNKAKDKGKGKSGGGSGGGSEGLAAGDTAAYKDGVKITVSAARSYSPSEYAAGHTEGNKAYQVTVTLENTGDKKFDSTLVTSDARAGDDGVAAEQIFDEKVGSGFSGTILPGKKSTVTYAFDAPATAKNLTVEVSPGILHDASVWELTL